jgi:seryl-tRNA synthetase
MILNFDAIRQDPKAYAARLKKKGFKGNLDEILLLDNEYREMVASVSDLRAKRNEAAKSRDIEEGKRLKDAISILEEKETALENRLRELELTVPNAPFADVPDGGEESNQVVSQHGKIPHFDFPIKDHIELGESLDLLDLERAAKVSGARFYYLKNQAVELEWALLQLVKDKLVDRGFTLMTTPHMVKPDIMKAGGFIPGGEEEIYHLEKDDLYLIGTAEQSVLGYYFDEVLEADKLPAKFLAFSSSYRREAGSHGKDTKGIIRVHQFDKLEMFVISRPVDSDKLHEELVGIEEEILTDLGLPYQKVLLAAGDISRASAKTFDLEVWLPSQNRYLETSSASNTTDYQTRRSKIRYKTGEGKTEYAHALNATAMAATRMLVVLFENYQTKEGTIIIPEALRPYLKFDEITRRN